MSHGKSAGFGKRRFDRAATQAPSRSVATSPIQPRRVIAASGAAQPAKSPPLMTLTLIFALALIFAGQEFLALGVGPSFALNYRSLLAFGGADMSLLQAGQWWRLFTAPLLHANAAHIIGNGIVLLIVGLLLERLIGMAWFACVFAVSGVCGSVASITVNDPQIISVGASGAIMGLLATTLVCSFHPAARGRQVRMRVITLRTMIPALLPLGGDASTHALHIDYSAHMGGALAGVVLGLLINAVWPEGEGPPVLAPVAAGLALLGAAAAAISVVMIAVHYPAYQKVSASLAPDAEIPSDRSAAMLASNVLVERYPDDPRIRVVRVFDWETAGAHGAAEADLRAALSKHDQLAEMPPQFELYLRILLADELLEQGREGEAKVAAAPVCGHSLGDPDFDRNIARSGLCGPPPAEPLGSPD